MTAPQWPELATQQDRPMLNLAGRILAALLRGALAAGAALVLAWSR